MTWNCSHHEAVAKISELGENWQKDIGRSSPIWLQELLNNCNSNNNNNYNNNSNNNNNNNNNNNTQNNNTQNNNIKNRR